MTAGKVKAFANLGCGPAPSRLPAIFAGWQELRVDIEPAAQPEILADVTDLSAIGTGSMDAAWSSHCLEHLYQHDVVPALGEIRRILCDDGFLVMLVPDLQAVAAYIAADQMHEPIYQSPAGPITAHDVVFGYGPDLTRGRNFMAHRCGFTPTVLVEALKAAEYGEFAVIRRSNFELAAVAHKTRWPSEASRQVLVEQLRL